MRWPRLAGGKVHAQADERARRFIDRSSFPWHQEFELAAGLMTPGRNPVQVLLDKVSLPKLDGLSVLDIGTFNGGLAFTLERFGAAHVVALDIWAPNELGFAELKEFLHSKVEYVQGSVYDLSAVLGREQFDIVFCWGVIYHLRHPLLSLDNICHVLREGGTAYIESAISDSDLGTLAGESVTRFYRRELDGDSSNWFVPTVACLEDWCASSGLCPTMTTRWPDPPTRAMLTVRRESDIEFRPISYEVPMRAVPIDAASDVASREAWFRKVRASSSPS